MAASTIVYALAQSATNRIQMSAECTELSPKIMTQFGNGRYAAAETLLSTAITCGADRARDTCAGMIMNNMAALLAASGRMADAERLAERSVKTLERIYPPDDLVLLRPRWMLVATLTEQGKIAVARDVFKRMLSIRTERPEDRAVVHGAAAVLLESEGRLQEAESECLATFQAWEEAGHTETRYAGAVVSRLGWIYIEEGRFDQARQALDRGFSIFNSSRDTVPMDHIKLLNLRGVLYARQGAWEEAEQNLSAALSMADRQRSVDPVFLRTLLNSYAYVLRKNHHRREARLIEARAARLPPSPANSTVVDVTELLAKRTPAKK